MTDKPIIFSAPMVRALLDGRKTQTRRVLKHQPTHPAVFQGIHPISRHALFNPASGDLVSDCEQIRIRYAPGDRLWVKETWGLGVSDHGDCPRYKATMDYQCGDKIKSPHEGPFNWRSPIYMPRRASRLTLHVTDVRVQRVQDITEADAVSEGVEAIRASNVLWAKLTPENLFGCLWNSLHGLDAWERNDWVAAITFDVEARNE